MDEKKNKRPRVALTDLLLLAGCASVSTGAFLLHVAAGCMVLGAVLVCLALLLGRGGEGG